MGILPGQGPGGHSAGGCSPNVRDRGGIHRREETTVLRVEQEYSPLMGFESGPAVPREESDDFAAYDFRVAKIGRHDTEEPLLVWLPHGLAEGKDGVPTCERPEHLIHDLYAFVHREELLDDLVASEEYLHIESRINSGSPPAES